MLSEQYYLTMVQYYNYDRDRGTSKIFVKLTHDNLNSSYLEKYIKWFEYLYVYLCICMSVHVGTVFDLKLFD